MGFVSFVKKLFGGNEQTSNQVQEVTTIDLPKEVVNVQTEVTPVQTTSVLNTTNLGKDEVVKKDSTDPKKFISKKKVYNKKQKVTNQTDSVKSNRSELSGKSK